MKSRFLVMISIFLLLMVSLACNLATGKPISVTNTPQPMETQASSAGGIPLVATASTTPTHQAVAAASPTPVPPTPAVKKLPWGTYRNIGEISDQFLENYPVMGGGVPPLTWFSGVISMTVAKDSTISGGTAYIDIFTNYTAQGQPCDKGEYQYEADQVKGSYDSQTGIITLLYTGNVHYSPENVPEHCPDTNIDNVEITIYVMHGDGNQYLLCKTGEQGDACLQNPMAKLIP